MVRNKSDEIDHPVIRLIIITGGIYGEVHNTAVRSGGGRGEGAGRGEQHVRYGEGADEVDGDWRRRSWQEGRRGRRGWGVRAVAEAAAAAAGAADVVSGADDGVRVQDQRGERRQGRVAPDAVAAAPRLPRTAAPAPPIPTGRPLLNINA